MSSLNESSSDMSLGNIEENSQIKTKPSIQAIALNGLKMLERKRSQDKCSTNSNSNIRIKPRKISSTSKLSVNDLSKKVPEEKTKKTFSFNRPNANLIVKKLDEDKFKSASKIQKGKTNIQSFIRQIQNNCKELKSKIKIGGLVKKKDSSDSPEAAIFIKRRVSKSPSHSKRSPKKAAQMKSPNFCFQPRKLSVNPNGKILKKAFVSKSPSRVENKIFSSPRSENLLIKKFEQEFSKTINDIGFDSTGQLGYSKFCQVLQNMHFINYTKEKTDEERELTLKAWKFLGGNDYSKISKKILCSFLMAISNLLKKTRSSSNDAEFSGIKNGTLFLTVEDVKRIHKEFHLLYINRKTPRLNSISKTPQKRLVENLPVERKDSEKCPVKMPDLLLNTQAAIYQTTPSKTKNKLDGVEEYKINSKPTLPKAISQKSTGFRSGTCSPENYLQLKSYHSSSAESQDISENYFHDTSQNENTENSLINPLVTPPNYVGKVLQFYDDNISKENFYDKISKRYKCQSSASWEESDDSILVTVPLPEEQESKIKVCKEDDLNLVIKDFGTKHSSVN